MEIFVLRDGQQTGPFNPETVQTLCERGGLSLHDMAWHQGLPGWLPLGEVLNPGSERPSAPPPTPISSGIRPAPKKSASAKQKALLKYLGATYEEDITKEDAAVAISDALENPKYTAKLQRWGEERIKQHPDLYQDEIDFRRANRVARYLERCETEASEAVADVTKAHVQVLVESLDKKNPNWERDPKDALWNHLLPAISEHFPQLVQEKWKNRLRPAHSKVATAIAASEAPLPSEHAEPAPGVFSAAIRGLLYGGVVLGIILGANHLLKKPDPEGPDKKPATTSAPANPPPGAPAANPPNPEASLPPAHSSTAPLVNPVPDATAPAAAPAPAPAEGTPLPTPGATPALAPAPAPVDPAMAPAADPAMAAGAPPTAPAVPPAPTPGLDVPAAPTPGTTGDPVSGGFKSMLTIVKPVAVQLQFGKVTLNTGTRVRFIALEGANVRVNFNNNVILVPSIATDIDPTAVPPAPAPATVTAPLAPPAPAPVATPAAPTGTPKPSSDL